MHFDWMTFGLQIVNFGVLVLLLNRFLYRPVLGAVEKRRAEIAKHYAEAEAAEAEAKARLEALAAAHASIAAERETLLAAAAAEALRLAESSRAKAREAAAALLGEGKRELAEERVKILAEAKRVALDLGTDLASKLLAGTPPDAWLPSVLDHLGALPEAERAGLRQDLRLVTALALDEASRGEWQEKLRRALDAPDLPVDFATDPALLSGVELHFASGILSLSGRSGLAALRAEAETKTETAGDAA